MIALRRQLGWHLLPTPEAIAEVIRKAPWDDRRKCGGMGSDSDSPQRKLMRKRVVRVQHR